MHSAAWRISLWATLAFACGTLVVFVFLAQFVASDTQRRSDTWLSGEVEVLGDVAERTPNDALYGRVLGEVAELAAHEVPERPSSAGASSDTVFFLQRAVDGTQKLWVGPGNGAAFSQAIASRQSSFEKPSDITVPGFDIPFRVASARIDDGSHIFLGLSERDQLRVLRNLRLRFSLLWFSLVLLGFAIVFFTTRRMLSHVRGITDAASHIGRSDLTTRVPATNRNDEIAQLAHTLNRMLDRIENSVHQLHTITDSLAHDLRSPLTAIRGKLEASLATTRDGEQTETVVSVLDELDRLTDFLNKSLDVAEARADALRLSPSDIDLDELLRSMIDLYEPSMSEKGLHVKLLSHGPSIVKADPGLAHRMVANLFDNELKHVPSACTVTLSLRNETEEVVLTLMDDGNGFDSAILPQLFVQRTKSKSSTGHGLGLAFVDAVVRAHGGDIRASNRAEGGVEVEIRIPLAHAEPLSGFAGSFPVRVGED
ncbi:MAG TPA: ATP-binding protein [Terracidiphilus sp.]|nr:ATP-binding protein [Terracidiphilus sp.]